MRYKFLAIYIVIIISFLTSVGETAIIKEIGDPNVMPRFRNKIVVLEYDTPETWGQELSQVIAQETIGSIRGVNGIGVINLRQPTERVGLSPEKIEEIAREQEALVVIWGELYQDAANVYLHSHLRIFPRETHPESLLNLLLETSEGVINANPPTLQINFTPMKISSKSLKDLHTFYDQTITIRKGADHNAEPIGTLKLGDEYELIMPKDDWTKITVHKRNITGWIRHSTLGSQEELTDIRSVIYFAHGILQYATGNYETAENTFINYLEKYGEKQDKMNKALAHILLGNSRLQAKGYKNFLPPEEKISKEYLSAVELLPNNASPLNYLAIARFMRYGIEQHTHNIPEINDIEERLIHVIKLENNIDSVRNLRIFYNHALKERSKNIVVPTDVTYNFCGDKYSNAILERIRLLKEIESELSR